VDTLDGQFLDGMGEILHFLGRGWTAKRVKALMRAGAPIKATGKRDGRRYFAVRGALDAWLRSAKR
jgi:hypothetical protein